VDTHSDNNQRVKLSPKLKLKTQIPLPDRALQPQTGPPLISEPTIDPGTSTTDGAVFETVGPTRKKEKYLNTQDMETYLRIRERLTELEDPKEIRIWRETRARAITLRTATPLPL